MKAELEFKVNVDIIKYSDIWKHQSTINNRYIKTEIWYISKDQIMEWVILELKK